MTPKIKNRLKVALAVSEKTNKWLAKLLGKDEKTVSKWCTNKSQPSLETLGKIALLLQIDIREVIAPLGKPVNKKQQEVNYG